MEKQKLYLKDWRIRRGMTQQQLADKVLVYRRATIADVERGIMRVPRRYVDERTWLRALARALGLQRGRELYRSPYRERRKKTA